MLATQLHSVVPFDYMALILHDAATDDLRLAVLEPSDAPVPPFRTMPVAARGPAGVVWETQQPAVIPIPDEGPLPVALEFLREHDYRVACCLPLTTVHRDRPGANRFYLLRTIIRASRVPIPVGTVELAIFSA